MNGKSQQSIGAKRERKRRRERGQNAVRDQRSRPCGGGGGSSSGGGGSG